MVKAIIPRRRMITKRNNLIEIVAWRVPKSSGYPEGVKYSFAFIHRNRRTIAFDNFNNEGHHKHDRSKKVPFAFESLEKTAEEFFRAVQEFENKVMEND